MNNKNIMGKDCLNLKNAGDEQEKHIAQKELRKMAGKLSHADIKVISGVSES